MFPDQLPCQSDQNASRCDIHRADCDQRRHALDFTLARREETQRFGPAKFDELSVGLFLLLAQKAPEVTPSPWCCEGWGYALSNSVLRMFWHFTFDL